MPSCESCKDLDISRVKIPIQQLQQGVASGCEACSMLQEGIRQFAKSLDGIVSLDVTTGCGMKVRVMKQSSQRDRTFEFYTQEDHPAIWQRIGPGRDVSVDSSSDQCITLAKGWLEDCLKKHPACAPPIKPALPTRVIEVGSSDMETRLRITKGKKARYAALSHCWGSGSPMSTTRASLKGMKKSLQFDESSKTFWQAVNVTRRLGIRYLWIDSLCIIQDSKEDWATESARMSDVYNNALVTISADAAADASQGLFPNPKVRRTFNEVYPIDCPGPGGKRSRVYVRPRYEALSGVEGISHASIEPEESKLSTRGWVLQERVLSPRMLHFSKEELSWVCSTYSHCECRVWPGQRPSDVFRQTPAKAGKDPELSHALYMEWPIIIRSFTRKNLSLRTDKLPALSGLAGWMQKQTGDDYLCGLWRNDLAFELLWYSDHQSNAIEPPYRHDHFYAPSWSWASVCGPISYFGRFTGQFAARSRGYPRDEIEPDVDVIGAAVVHQGPNQYGPAREGFLKIHGLILPVGFDSSRKLWMPKLEIKSFCSDLVNVILDVPSEMAENASKEAARSFAFLLMGQYMNEAGISISSLEAVCLLLEKCDPTIPKYTRLGFVKGAGSIAAWKATLTKQLILIC